MKIVFTLRTYLVPNVDSPIVRIPIWQETQTFETHDWRLQYQKDIYVAYKEDNGNSTRGQIYRVKMHILRQYLLVQLEVTGNNNHTITNRDDRDTYSYGSSLYKPLKCLGCACFAKCVI